MKKPRKRWGKMKTCIIEKKDDGYLVKIVCDGAVNWQEWHECNKLKIAENVIAELGENE